MKTQLTTRCLLRIILCVLVLGCRVWAGQSFFDDFSDGDPADGSPVNWVGVYDQDNSGYTLTPEGLKLSSAIASDRDGTPYIYRDVSVSAQIKRTSNHTNNNWVSGFCCRWNDGGPGGYWIEVRSPNRFWLGHRDRWRLTSAVLPFNVDEREFIIRVDMIGDQIKGWCWPADEPMPDEPQITLVEDVVPDGMFVIYAGTQGGQAIYRWVEAVSMDVPVVDLNGDGKVDIEDLLKLIRYWGQADPAADLSANGTVDKEDLEILMDYWQQPVNDITLLTHWALDEAQGDIACDRVGLCDAALVGGPAWDPDGGQVDGALLLDGLDDCAVAPSVWNPGDGPFSVFAWIKGGRSGQVILSQEDGVNWLMADAQAGCLKTDVSDPIRSSRQGHTGGFPLISPALMTDGNWHRVGLVWDGSNRILYVDDVVVAEDMLPNLASASGSLLIGTGSGLEPGTFWSGLIDEVRIYNRAVKP